MASASASASASAADAIGTVAMSVLPVAAGSSPVPTASDDDDGGCDPKGFFPADSVQTAPRTFVVLSDDHMCDATLRTVKVTVTDGQLSYGPVVSAQISMPRLRFPGATEDEVREARSAFRKDFGSKNHYRLNSARRLLPDGRVCYIEEAGLIVLDHELKLASCRPLAMAPVEYDFFSEEERSGIANFLQPESLELARACSSSSLDNRSFFFVSQYASSSGRSCSHTALWWLDIDEGVVYRVHDTSVGRPRIDVPDAPDPQPRSRDDPKSKSRECRWDKWDELNMSDMPGVVRDAEPGQLAQVNAVTLTLTFT